MGFRINTNISAMNAHKNSLQNNAALNKSLQRLSSGLRINTAADDASGLAIANQLRAQSTGLGQAISNANDGVGVMQTADGALDEYENIINTVRTKAIQAASDGQNADSRKAIQADIDKLLQEANNIAETTQFNGQSLLDGSFQNKSFHIGAYAAETVDTSIGSAKTSDVGSIASVNNNGSTTVDGSAKWDTIDSTGSTANVTETKSGYVLKAGQISVNGVDLSSSMEKLDPFRIQDAKALASAITDATDIVADAKTQLTGSDSIGGTSTALASGTTLIINGAHIDLSGKTYAGSDADGTLTRLINDVSDDTGVKASIEGGKLKLTAEDGRNITVTGTGGDSAAVLTDINISDNATNDTSTASVASLASTATAAVTIAEGELVINGHDMAGTYGDGATTGSAADALEDAIQALEGFELSSIDDDGKITLKVDDGQDLNIAGTEANNTYNLTKGVTNTSEHGVVNMYSDSKITIGGDDDGTFGFTSGGYTPTASDKSLDSIDVTSRNAAEVAILITDSALKAIDSLRSEIGSTQNQLESTVRNISTTQVNVAAAESQIRDVDFAAESANFSKHNILAQSGTYAMSQANAVQQNVMRLLQ